MASAGWLAGCVTMFVLAAGTARLNPVSEPLLAASPRELTLTLNLTSTQALPAWSAGALIAETNAIWRDSHLRLRWRMTDLSESPQATADSLRVLVMSGLVPAGGDPSTVTVGELVRGEGSSPVAMASITAARRIVEASRRFQILELLADSDHRVGLVLGRAVAHEMGHYLLRTSTHATRGLMRASIDAQEFADVRSRAFRLDGAAQAYLASLVARGRLLEPSVPVFSYAQGR